jgi:hypothetical protein
MFGDYFVFKKVAFHSIYAGQENNTSRFDPSLLSGHTGADIGRRINLSISWRRQQCQYREI